MLLLPDVLIIFILTILSISYKNYYLLIIISLVDKCQVYHLNLRSNIQFYPHHHHHCHYLHNVLHLSTHYLHMFEEHFPMILCFLHLLKNFQDYSHVSPNLHHQVISHPYRFLPQNSIMSLSQNRQPLEMFSHRQHLHHLLLLKLIQYLQMIL